MVDCGSIQAALSARLDGEPAGIDDEIIDAHLAHCSDCRNFYDRAAELNRQLNFRAAPSASPPDLADIILAEVEPTWRRRANARVIWSTVSRVLLVILGVLYAAWAIGLLTDAAKIDIEEDPLTARLLAEAATSRLGLTAGLLFAAWRPKIIGGILPIFGALWTFSLGFAARDLIFGIADSATATSIAMLLASAVVLVLAWLNNAGVGVLRRTWGSLSATPA